MMRAGENGCQHLVMDVSLSEDQGDYWRHAAAVTLDAMRAHLTSKGMEAVEAPPMPPEGVEGYLDGPFRILRAYDPFPVIGIADERDDDGSEIYIYGQPCWRVRVDTLARPVLLSAQP